VTDTDRDPAFDQVQQDPQAAFDFLTQKFRNEKQYARLFEIRLLRKRHELGLSLVDNGALEQIPADKRPAYEQAFVDAAREAGNLYLAEGDIPRAWSYFRAIGEPAPIAAAIERSESSPDPQTIIEIAFQEGVHPEKGFRLILEHYGLCRAISAFEQVPRGRSRIESLHLLLRTLHAEVVENLRRVIEQNEGSAPPAASIADLIASRDWLFGEFSYYADTSHVIAILRFSLELRDLEMLALARDLAEYGERLSPQFHYRGDPPFEDFEDYSFYFRALLGRDVDAAVAHFEQKPPESAPVLMDLLARLGRFDQLAERARAQDDLLTYTAAIVMHNCSAIPAERL
jgi:hypothetical protein